MDASSTAGSLAGVFGLTFVFTVIGIILSLYNGGHEWMIAIKWWILSAAQVAAMTPTYIGR